MQNVCRNSFKGITLISLTLLLGACGVAQNESRQVVSVEPQYADYVQRFEEIAKSQGRPMKIKNLIVKTGDLPQAANGVQQRAICETAPGLTPTITVDADSWHAIADGEAHDLDREELMFHELGHCVLGRTHNSGVEQDGLPVTVMNPYRIDRSIYQYAREYYLNELFHPTKK